MQSYDAEYSRVITQFRWLALGQVGIAAASILILANAVDGYVFALAGFALGVACTGLFFNRVLASYMTIVRQQSETNQILIRTCDRWKEMWETRNEQRRP